MLARVTDGTAYTAYYYDADGARSAQNSNNGSKTLYLGALEVDTTSNIVQAMRSNYSFGGQTVAVGTINKAANTRAVTYLHADHLGSISLATGNGGTNLCNEVRHAHLARRRIMCTNI